MSKVKDDLSPYVSEMIDKITYSPKAVREAADRCTSFLTTCAVLAMAKRDLEVEKARAQTVLDCQLKISLEQSTAKLVTEKKVDAQASKEYCLAREAFEELDADIGWVRTLIHVFENAHVVYRQIAKGE